MADKLTPLAKLAKPEFTDNDYERIARSINRAGEVGKRLTASGLSRRAVVVLLHDATGVPMKDIRCVLDSLETLASWCLASKRKGEA